LSTDFGKAAEAAEVLSEYFSGDTFSDMELLAAMLEAKDEHWRRSNSPWSAKPIEFPLYLYPGEKIFTALHPQNQILKYSPPAGTFFTTDLRSACRCHAGHFAGAEEILSMLFRNRPAPDIGSENAAFLESFLNQCRRRGYDDKHVAGFFSTRQLAESMLVPSEAQKVFLGAYASYIGPRPWMIWVENWATLFQPYATTGDSWDFDFGAEAIQPLLLHLAHPNCTAIVTHVRATFNGLKRILSPHGADHKLAYVPLSYPGRACKAAPAETIRILFMNSFGGSAQQFAQRGGLELIQAFRRLPDSIRDRCELTLLGRIPYDLLDESEAEFIRTSRRLKVVEKFLPDAEVEKAVARSDLFLIPARSFHSCCVVQALSHGVPVMATRCWGYEEYIRQGFNGVLLDRAVDYNWIDSEGILREKANPSAQRFDPVLARELAGHLEKLIQNPERLREMSLNAHAAAGREFSIDRRNERLARLL
jgi:glycosyltransferase involved in cell wall biosynthesis